jgi:hypothetical protein
LVVAAVRGYGRGREQGSSNAKARRCCKEGLESAKHVEDCA